MEYEAEVVQEEDEEVLIHESEPKLDVSCESDKSSNKENEIMENLNDIIISEEDIDEDRSLTSSRMKELLAKYP